MEHLALEAPASSMRIITEVSRLSKTGGGRSNKSGDFPQVGHHRVAGIPGS